MKNTTRIYTFSWIPGFDLVLASCNILRSRAWTGRTSSTRRQSVVLHCSCAKMNPSAYLPLPLHSRSQALRTGQALCYVKLAEYKSPHFQKLQSSHQSYKYIKIAILFKSILKKATKTIKNTLNAWVTLEAKSSPLSHCNIYTKLTTCTNYQWC